MAQLTRYLDGFTITGDRLVIDLHIANSGEAGTLSVSVNATAAATGFSRDSRLTDSELRHEFKQDEIVITDNRLECFAVRLPSVPEYREGFSLVLELGMDELLRQALPKLFRVGSISGAVLQFVNESLGRPAWPHEINAVTDVVARCALDVLPTTEAIASAHDWNGELIFPRAAELMVAFQNDSVIALLDSAANVTG